MQMGRTSVIVIGPRRKGLVLGYGTGEPPPFGHVFLRGKNGDGSYSILSGLNADASRSNLAGKVS